MAADYDQQLLESVAVRRNRMTAALLFGENRARRPYADGVRRSLVGLVIAGLMAAGCVGYSFVRHAMVQARAQNQQLQPSTTPTRAVTPAPRPSAYLASNPEPVVVVAANGAAR